jgi:hypothetical protein
MLPSSKACPPSAARPKFHTLLDQYEIPMGCRVVALLHRSLPWRYTQGIELVTKAVFLPSSDEH